MKRGIQSILVLLLLGACASKTEHKPIAKIGDEPIYMDNVDSLLGDQLSTMRVQALQSLIAIELMKKEAEKKGLNHQQYKQLEIFEKVKDVSWKEVSAYALRNGIEPQDSNQWNLLREQRKLAYRKSRHMVLIDSLRRVYQVQEFLNRAEDSRNALIDQLEGHERGAPKPLAEVHLIFDYNCGHCMIEKDVLEQAFTQWGGLVKFNYVYHAPEYEERGRLADAIGRSGNFWQAWPLIVNEGISNKALEQLALEKRWITNPIVDEEARFKQNKEHLVALGIYSVPTYILNGTVLPPNTSADELLGYLYAQLTAQAQQQT